jgi:hypothetical protein
MTWTAETIESTMRGGLKKPDGYRDLFIERDPHCTDTWIEFNELMNDDKMVDA